jgi:transcriptional regulator with XRE-family HTH domain
MINPRPPGNKINTFGKNLKKIRTEFNWSQEQLARFLNVNRSALGSWEEGRAHPNILLLIKIVAKLRVKDIIGLVTDENFKAEERAKITFDSMKMER